MIYSFTHTISLFVPETSYHRGLVSATKCARTINQALYSDKKKKRSVLHLLSAQANKPLLSSIKARLYRIHRPHSVMQFVRTVARDP